MARRDKFSEQQKENIAKCRAKKNARRRKRKAENQRLREAGVKF